MGTIRHATHARGCMDGSGRGCKCVDTCVAECEKNDCAAACVKVRATTTLPVVARRPIAHVVRHTQLIADARLLERWRHQAHVRARRRIYSGAVQDIYTCDAAESKPVPTPAATTPRQRQQTGVTPARAHALCSNGSQRRVQLVARGPVAGLVLVSVQGRGRWSRHADTTGHTGKGAGLRHTYTQR